jgi:hypothetical protein
MFDNVLSDIEEIFSTTEWIEENIALYPDNYQGQISNDNEFCRLSVLPSDSENYAHGGNKLIQGLVIIKLFVKAGEGQGRLMAIADILDNYLENKKLTNSTELGTSYLNVEGLDPANKSLYSARYIIPFKLYGE